MLTVLCLLMPESPRWLCSVGRHDAASKALKKLRNSQYVGHELIHIETTLAKEPKKGNWLLLFKNPLLPRRSRPVEKSIYK